MSRLAGRTSFERLLINVAAFVIVVAGMKAAEPILVPFLLAVFIAVITTPLLIALQRTGMRSGFALLIITLGLVVIGFLIIQVAGRSVNDFTKKLPAYTKRLQTHQNQFMDWLKEKGVEVPKQSADRERANPGTETLPDERPDILVDPQELLRYLANLAATVSTLFGKGVIIMLVAVFILLELAALPRRIRQVPGLTEEMWERLGEITNNVRQYMVMKTIMSLATGLLVWLWLAVLRLDYAFLLGLLAFALNFIPAIGSIIAALPAIFLALALLGPTPAVVCAVGYLVINIGISNFIEPRFMGRSLRLSPLIILLSVIFWGWVLGPMGMLLSVPITMAVKIALESTPETVWLALLLGPPTVKRTSKAAALPPDASERPVRSQGDGHGREP